VAVELHLTPDDRWPVEPDQLMALVAEAGFAGLGVFRRWVDEGTADALGAHGLRCREVLAHIIRDDAERTLLRAGQLAEVAALVGADWILTVFETDLTEESVALARRSAAVMSDAGTAMALEFTPLGPVGTLGAGLELADALGHGVKLVVDSWHVCLGATTWEELERAPLERVAYVQFDDALPPISDDARDESTNRRTVPGAGILELERFATTLLDRGWEGPVSVEVLGGAVGLPVPELVRASYQASARFWL